MHPWTVALNKQSRIEPLTGKGQHLVKCPGSCHEGARQGWIYIRNSVQEIRLWQVVLQCSEFRDFKYLPTGSDGTAKD